MISLTRLRCEYQTNPLGIDEPHPRLSWTLNAARRATTQEAYQLRAASTLVKLLSSQPDLWDSGRVTSAQSVQVPYAGQPLSSRQRAWWQVRVWDDAGQTSGWSEPAWFEMGLLRRKDWQARWIGMPGADKDRPGAAPLLRKVFEVRKPVQAARVYICGLGYHELYLNGARVGDHHLDPAFRFDRRALYVTHDVTELLRPGPNALGVMLGNGLYNQAAADAWNFQDAPWRASPCLLLQCWVRYLGGEEVLVSDTSWKAARGPETFDATRLGEFYDARREMPGWAAADFDDSGWQAAAEVEGPPGRLSAQMLPPVRVQETVAPVSVRAAAAGIHVFDMGRNFAGWAQLRVSGPAGATLRLAFGEKLGADGRLDRSEISGLVFEGEVQVDQYTLRGGGEEEVWDPRFTYHGFQYVEVSGFPGEPRLENLRGQVAHTDFAPAGSFACSNELLNRIQACALNSYTSNFHGYPTDCPQREKNGWTGDAHLAAEAGLFNFQSAAGYTKWLQDIEDEQRPDGSLPGIVPTSGWGYEWGNGACWDSACILIPWYLYLYCGDERILASHYDMMKRYVDYLELYAQDGLVINGLGDWVPPYGRPEDYTVPAALLLTAYACADARILSRAAALLGKMSDAGHYAALAESFRAAINKRYYDPISGLYAGGSQTALGAALHLGLVPPGDEGRVLEQLMTEIQQQKGRLNVGIHGAKFVLNALAEGGAEETAYRVAVQRQFPGWGWWMEQGATTLWENWDGSASQNHIMFGDISAWCFKVLAGIRPDPDKPGFKHFSVRPHLPADLEWVRAEHLSPYGRIRSAWQQAQGRFALEVEVPANTSASVHLPPGEPREGGLPLEQADGVQLVARMDQGTLVEVGSGVYRFEVVG